MKHYLYNNKIIITSNITFIQAQFKKSAGIINYA